MAAMQTEASTLLDGVTEVQVEFRAKTAGDDESVLPPHSLTVPLRLGRYGLSEIVNALLQQGNA